MCSKGINGHLAGFLSGDVADERLAATYRADGVQVHANDEAADGHCLCCHLEPATCATQHPMMLATERSGTDPSMATAETASP